MDPFLSTPRYYILSGESINIEWQRLCADLEATGKVSSEMNNFIAEHRGPRWDDIFFDLALQWHLDTLARELIGRLKGYSPEKTESPKRWTYPNPISKKDDKNQFVIDNNFSKIISKYKGMDCSMGRKSFLEELESELRNYHSVVAEKSRQQEATPIMLTRPSF